MLSTPTGTILAFVALVLENELQYHGLAVRIIRRDDGVTLSKKIGELLTGNSNGDGAYLCTYVFVFGENRPNICIRHAAIQKCHGILLQ